MYLQFQIYLVTGGLRGDHSRWYHISSTEEFIKGGTSWTLTENSLPTRMNYIGSLSYNNQVFVTGNYFEQNTIPILNQTPVILVKINQQQSNCWLMPACSPTQTRMTEDYAHDNSSALNKTRWYLSKKKVFCN